MNKQYIENPIKSKSDFEIQKLPIFMPNETADQFWLRILKEMHDQSLLSNHGVKLWLRLREENGRAGSVAKKA